MAGANATYEKILSMNEIERKDFDKLTFPIISNETPFEEGSFTVIINDYSDQIEIKSVGKVRDTEATVVRVIKKEVDFSHKYYIDTGPLIDRELAKRTGIGYYGKNSSIINDKYGSFIFIGYILTDLDIDISNEEIPNKCGDCNLCIKACPTGALEGDYKFNPKKCISYLTQTKEKIPYELRSKMGDKIYGCDTCQLACPKNKNIIIPNHEEFIPKITKGYMDIEEIFNISNKEFKKKYGNMSGAWRGKNILKRNGIIVLGNTKDRKNLKLLLPLLKDPNPMIREYTAWAILNIDYSYGKEVAEKAIKSEVDDLVKLEMKNLL